MKTFSYLIVAAFVLFGIFSTASAGDPNGEWNEEARMENGTKRLWNEETRMENGTKRLWNEETRMENGMRRLWNEETALPYHWTTVLNVRLQGTVLSVCAEEVGNIAMVEIE